MNLIWLEENEVGVRHFVLNSRLASNSFLEFYASVRQWLRN